MTDRPLPTIVFHGDRDTTVHPNNGDRILKQSVGASKRKRKAKRGQVPGGCNPTPVPSLPTSAGARSLEHWNIHGAGHAWAGGSPAGSYTDPRGPDATREMLRFFLETFARGVVGRHSALGSSGTSPNFRISLASLNSLRSPDPPFGLNAIAPAQPGLCYFASERMKGADGACCWVSVRSPNEEEYFD